MTDTKYQQYKPAKNLDEQVNYLKENKRVLFNDMSEEEGKDKLLRYNYINIISPYKHKFALLDAKKEVIKQDGKHVYNRNVEFSEYYDYFRIERESYPDIVTSILDFEIHFKSIVAYHVFNSYEFNNSNDVITFFDKLSLKLNFMSNEKYKRIPHMQRSINNMRQDIFKYHDVYCFFDRLSLGNTLTLFECLDNEVQDKIFDDMKKYQWNFGVYNISHFIDKLFCLVSIRNCEMHSNSLEILVRFYDAKNHGVRKISDRKKYTKLIKYLKERKNSQL